MLTSICTSSDAYSQTLQGSLFIAFTQISRHYQVVHIVAADCIFGGYLNVAVVPLVSMSSVIVMVPV